MGTRKSSIAIGLVFAATLLIVLVGLLFGARTLSIDAVLRVLFAPDGKIESILVWTLRLPRSLAPSRVRASLSRAICCRHSPATRWPIRGSRASPPAPSRPSSAASSCCHRFHPPITRS